MRVRTMLIIASCLLVFGTVAWADNTFEGFQIVRVVFNQQEVQSEVPAVNFFGRTVLPLRKVAELAGLNVDKWDADTNTVYLSGGLGQAVATVNGEPISKAELYDRLSAQNGAAMVNDMITEKLVDQAAKEAGVTITPAEVDQEISKIKQQLGGEAQFQAALKQNNITLSQLRTYQAMRLKMVKLLAPSIPMGDEQLKAYFEENRAQFDQRTVHARHILVATEQEAKAIKAELDKGADFAAIARARSTDPGSKASGGDLGTFGPGRMVPEFEKVAFSLKAGEISQPFNSPFGWHVVQVLEVNGSAPDFAAIKADVQAKYTDAQVQEQMQPWLQQLRAKAVITNTLGK